VLKEKVDFYLKVRLWFFIYMTVVAIIIGIVFCVFVRDWVMKNGSSKEGEKITESQATIIALIVLLGFLIPVIIVILIIYGYRKSFDESTYQLARSNRSRYSDNH
jgi:Na+/H+ antiporter NhaC